MAEPQTASAISANESKELQLRSLMRGYGRVLVAYSGGVDSAYLAYVANDELGPDAVCITGISPSVPQVQRDEAYAVAVKFGFNHRFVATDELEDVNYTANPSDRCFHCKSELYSKLGAIAKAESIAFVVDGSNADDAGDYRPGMSAAAEKGVVSPLREVGMTKDEIRELSKTAGLPGWDKPASPCLSSRIAYGVPVTIERLSKIERGEAMLRELGFREFRVRVHAELARIEIAPSELAKALDPEFAATVSDAFTKLGFRFVTLDLRGFRSGAMNEVLEK
ncbi:MAG: ATP-dependent sacrificial sulfur transferase LarE [Acidobacteria bacterium]|nr:ATP-dependent sacrificial sulfur transferase LarE [Acidobacteriota bacterium]